MAQFTNVAKQRALSPNKHQTDLIKNKFEIQNAVEFILSSEFGWTEIFYSLSPTTQLFMVLVNSK